MMTKLAREMLEWHCYLAKGPGEGVGSRCEVWDPRYKCKRKRVNGQRTFSNLKNFGALPLGQYYPCFVPKATKPPCTRAAGGQERSYFLAALRRSAQRFFISSERRLRPAAVMPPPPVVCFFAAPRPRLAPPSSASIARSSRSRSSRSCWSICSVFTNHPKLNFTD